MGKPKVEARKITDLRQDPSNANKGSERGLRILDDSVAQSGPGRGGVMDKNGILIGGNKTQERLVDHGFEDVIVVHTTGKEWVVTQRDDLDLLDEDPNNPARQLAYRDNLSSLHMAWDADQIAADVQAGVNFEGMFTPDEIDELLDRVNFLPVGIDEQPRLDEKKPITCPHCGMEFVPGD